MLLVKINAMSKDLWQLANEKLKQPKKLELAEDDEAAAPREESTLILCGSKASGKTTLVHRFLDRDDQPKPTIALEYTFARRTRGNVKEIGHLWEIGGGTHFNKLLQVPINENIIESLAIIIFLDLSKLDELWTVLESTLTALRQAVDDAIKSKGNSDLMKSKAWERIGGEGQKDKELLQLFPVPLAFIGSRYDEFQNFENEKRLLTSKTLRFVAHLLGAHLLFYSTKIEALVTRGRALASHLVFNTTSSKAIQVDHNKPVSVFPGGDSFADIGPPNLSDAEIRALKSTFDMWKQAYCKAIPQKTVKLEIQEDPTKDPQFKEDTIDALRIQKDQELEKYLKQRAREKQMTATA